MRPSQPGEEPIRIQVPLTALDRAMLVSTGERPAYVQTGGAAQRLTAPDGPISPARTLQVGAAAVESEGATGEGESDEALSRGAAEDATDAGPEPEPEQPQEAPAAARQPPAFADALGLSVRCFGVRVPLWAPVGALAGAAAVPGLVLALAGITGVTGGYFVGAATGRDAPSASMSAPAPGPPGSRSAGPRATPRAAAAGLAATPEMLKAIEARPATERTPGETLLLGRSLDVQATQKVTDLGHELERNPKLLADPKTATTLIELARDARTAMAAIELMVRLPAPLGPDLLYETWTGTAERTDATRTAQDLLLSKEIRARASPALGIAIDLRTLELCGDLLPVVEQAAEQADRRAIPLLTKLENRQGCGPTKHDDCYACLREEHRVPRALERARRTPAPVFK